MTSCRLKIDRFLQHPLSSSVMKLRMKLLHVSKRGNKIIHALDFDDLESVFGAEFATDSEDVVGGVTFFTTGGLILGFCW
jgi:hypothetical protein